jgi:hypothetical protein
MKKLTPPHDLVEAMGEAYELLLEKAIEKAKHAEEKTGPALHSIIDSLREEISAAGELSEEQVEKVANYLKRDLRDAAEYIEETGEGLKEWLGFEQALLGAKFWDMFAQAADQTTVELLMLKDKAEHSAYRTGEITGPGTLLCDNCGETLHFKKPGHIPPCPKCNETSFHRQPPQ